LAIDTYMKSFFKNDKKIAIVRAGNVIGGWDWSKDRLIPDIVKSIMQDEILTIRNPNAVRPWQYVLEALYWYLIIGAKIFENSQYEGAYNFWPDMIDTLRVIDIVEKAIEVLWKWKYQIVPDSAIHEAWLLLLDNTKAKTLLWWKSKYHVQEVLEKTLKYYKACHLQQDIQALALEEIHSFVL
jgi:CDP-glucose 4,6-dehydratase